MHMPSEAGPEQMMLAFVTKRVNGWPEMQPFYGEKSGPRKSVESRVTESVLNALVLARYDSLKGTMTPTTKTAFDNMWAVQLTSGDGAGGWEWLNFHNAPWEGETSSYWGATMAALAVGFAPESYRNSAEAQPHVAALRGYLDRHYEEQPLINKVILLWASQGMPGVLTAERKALLIAEIEKLQAADGGWSIAAMGPWKRQDNTAIDTHEDAYATGLCVLALKSAGLSNRTPQVRSGVAWLVTNQDATTGMWRAASLNKQRAVGSDAALFMSDSATGFAVMALEATR
jgi:squalene-hopene/tetraprenyl-beta-curcumene cyclase